MNENPPDHGPTASTQSNWPVDGGSGSQERSWAMMCHVAALAMFIFPFGNLIGPLVVWFAKRDEYSAVKEHGRASLNFQISMSVYFVVLLIALLVVIFGFGISAISGAALSGGPGGTVGAFGAAIAGIVLIVGIAGLLVLLGIAGLALIVLNSIRAYDGKTPMYPLAIPFIGK